MTADGEEMGHGHPDRVASTVNRTGTVTERPHNEWVAFLEQKEIPKRGSERARVIVMDGMMAFHHPFFKTKFLVVFT